MSDNVCCSKSLHGNFHIKTLLQAHPAAVLESQQKSMLIVLHTRAVMAIMTNCYFSRRKIVLQFQQVQHMAAFGYNVSDLARQINYLCNCAGCMNATVCRRSRPVESFGGTLHSTSLLAHPHCLLLWSGLLHFLANHCLTIQYLCLYPACLLAACDSLCAADLCC